MKDLYFVSKTFQERFTESCPVGPTFHCFLKIFHQYEC